jgi:plasmid stabilization system protein ParE
VKVTYREAVRHDVTAQFRYYLIERNHPALAIRFKEAVTKTVKTIGREPEIAPPCILQDQRWRNLRSWPVAGFEAVRIYFMLENDTIRIIRILHSKRNVWSILEREYNRKD